MPLNKIVISLVGLLTFSLKVSAQSPIKPNLNPDVNQKIEQAEKSQQLDIPQQVLDDSPTLQKWLEQTPNILQEIRQEPSFRSILGLGLVGFPEDTLGFDIQLKDLFLGNTGLTFNTDYQATFDSDHNSFGLELHYFMLPLGSRLNLAPVVGYRTLKQARFETDGINLGLRLLLVLSRTGAAEVSLSQNWIAPGGATETGLLKLETGYSLTSQISLTTSWQRQNSPSSQDNIFRIGLGYSF